MNVENCSNCGVVIGKSEPAYVSRGNVVCQNCHRKLTNTEDKQPQTETKEQAGAKSNKLLTQILMVCGLILILLVACLALPLVVKLVIRQDPLPVPTSSNSLQATIDKANKGDANAQFWLGIMCYCGNGVPEDHKEAIKWFTKAAKQGNANAQSSLGGICYEGKDYKEAFKWFTKAAEQGNANAQSQLGVMYYKSEGVVENHIEAYKWFLLAEMNGKRDTLKEELAYKMTSAQIAEAQKRAKEFTEKR